MREITGDLIVLGNLNLGHVNAFRSLASLQVVGCDLLITFNCTETLEGLEALTIVDGEMEVNRNFALRSLNGL